MNRGKPRIEEAAELSDETINSLELAVKSILTIAKQGEESIAHVQKPSEELSKL